MHRLLNSTLFFRIVSAIHLFLLPPVIYLAVTDAGYLDVIQKMNVLGLVVFVLILDGTLFLLSWFYNPANKSHYLYLFFIWVAVCLLLSLLINICIYM